MIDKCFLYVPNYLEVSSSNVIAQMTDISNGLTWTPVEDDSYGIGCMIQNDPYRCWQKFVVSTTINDCDSNTGFVFDNEILLLGDLQCLDTNDQTGACSDFFTGVDAEQSVSVEIGSSLFAYTKKKSY